MPVKDGCDRRGSSDARGRDAYTREYLALEVDTRFASRHLARAPDEFIEERGKPMSIRCDEGPELTGRHFLGRIEIYTLFARCGRVDNC